MHLGQNYCPEYFQQNKRRARASVLRTFAIAFSLGLTWLAPPVYAGTNTFSPVGPEGGGVFDIAFHPADPTIVYAATNGGLYRSTDSGHHWQLVYDRMAIYAPRALAVHPSEPNRVFAGAFGTGVLVSNDAGVTWTVLSNFPSQTTRDIQYSADGNTLYVATTNTVIRSADHGATWQVGGALPQTVNMIHHTMAIDGVDPQRVYVTASAQGFQSTDGGVTWQAWNMPYADVQDFAVSGPRIWAASYGGTFFTENRGSTWALAMPLQTMAVTVDRNNPQTIYSGTPYGLRRSTDNGTHWTNIQGNVTNGSSDDAGDPSAIAIDSSDPNHVLIAGTSGIAVTFDNGTTWGVGHNDIHALGGATLVSTPGSDRIYVQAPYEGVFAISAADGSSTALNNPQLRQLDGANNLLSVSTYGMLVVPGALDRLFLGRWQGVFRSDDAGTSWETRVQTDFNYQNVEEIISVSDDNQALIALAPWLGIFRSIDGGDTWTRDVSVDAYELRTIVSAPSNPRTIYLVARMEESADDVLMRSVDGGDHWTTLDVPDPYIVSLAVDPTNDRTIYMGATASALFKSTDGADTWTRLAWSAPYDFDPPALQSIALDPQNPRIVFVGGQKRIKRSVDGGHSWQELMNDAQRLGTVSTLTVDAQRPHILYASIAQRGVQQISIEPDLELTATTAAPVGHGASGAFAFRARNAGPFDATNVRTTVQLPTDATNVSATSTNGTCSVAANVVTCVAPTLLVNSPADITVNSTQPNVGSYALVASVEGDQPDTALANNTVTSNAEVTEVADLSVALDAPSRVARDTAITFLLSLSNAGSDAATTPTVSFSLAPGLGIASVTPATNCTISGTTVTCELATLAANASTTLSIVTAAATTLGSYTGTATVTATGTDPLASNDSATLSITVVEPIVGVIVIGGGGSSGGGSSGGGSTSGGGTARVGGGGGSTSPWMLLALLLLSAARPTRRPQPLT